jgi:drug/metabolite transporter (DMT)-like permease
MIGIFAAIGQFSLTYAYRFGKASDISIYNYSNIIFAAVIGFFIWGEISDIWSITGGSIIIIISIIVFIYNNRSKETSEVTPYLSDN